MSFLVLLVILWVEKFSAFRRVIQRDGFYLGELARLESAGSTRGHPWVMLFILVALPALLLAMLLWVVQPVAYGLLALPVHFLILTWSLGRGDLKAALGPLRDAWRRGDDQAALHVAERDVGLSAEGPGELVEAVQGWLLWQALQSFFSVVFWYCVLGPAAALAYRLVALACEHSRNPLLAERAGRVRHVLDWLPVRLLALSFALVGNFVAVCRLMLHELLSGSVSAASLAARCGRLAADLPGHPSSAQGVAGLDSLWSLLQRAAILWYALIALWTLLY